VGSLPRLAAFDPDTYDCDEIRAKIGWDFELQSDDEDGHFRLALVGATAANLGRALDRKNSIRQYGVMLRSSKSSHRASGWRRWRIEQRLHRG
jgi:hypothetical protein